MAEKPIPESPLSVSVTRHLKMSIRYALFNYPGRLPHVEAISRARTVRKDCHRPSRQKGLGSWRGEQQRGELEGSTVPTVEAGEALDDFGLGTVLLEIDEDALQRRLGLFEGREDLATK